MTYYDDIEIGAQRTTGSYTVTREEILDFGRRFDPQPFHVDEEAAERSWFGGLVASGWHTASICMRLNIDALQGAGGGSLGSPGVDEIRWRKPVRPGDTLTATNEVVDKRPLASKPDRGLVRSQWTVTNQHGDVVMTMIGLGFFPIRGDQDQDATTVPVEAQKENGP
jgi:acyl dehydratase